MFSKRVVFGLPGCSRVSACARATCRPYSSPPPRRGPRRRPPAAIRAWSVLPVSV